MVKKFCRKHYLRRKGFFKKTDKAIVCYGMADDFARAIPDEFKYDDSIILSLAYKMYVSSFWVSDNYLRKPERKPEWYENNIVS